MRLFERGKNGLLRSFQSNCGRNDAGKRDHHGLSMKRTGTCARNMVLPLSLS